MIGERLKHAFVGNDAWILSYKEECFNEIGLKPSDRISLYNGALACEFRKYQIFSGKYAEFCSSQPEKQFKTNRNTFRPHRLGEKRNDFGKERRTSYRAQQEERKEGKREKPMSYPERKRMERANGKKANRPSETQYTRKRNNQD